MERERESCFMYWLGSKGVCACINYSCIRIHYEGQHHIGDNSIRLFQNVDNSMMTH